MMNQWGVNLAQRQRSSTLWPSGDQTQFAVADSMSSVNACTDAGEMALPVTLITPLWSSSRRTLPTLPGSSASSTDRRLRCKIRTVRWLDSELRRLYSTWKACDRNHTLPCSYRDFKCDRLRPKYSIFDYVSMIDPTLLSTRQQKSYRCLWLPMSSSIISRFHHWFPCGKSFQLYVGYLTSKLKVLPSVRYPTGKVLA